MEAVGAAVHADHNDVVPAGSLGTAKSDHAAGVVQTEDELQVGMGNQSVVGLGQHVLAGGDGGILDNYEVAVQVLGEALHTGDHGLGTGVVDDHDLAAVGILLVQVLGVQLTGGATSSWSAQAES